MKRIALLFGGKSPEHEISVRSARNIFAAIDRKKFEVIIIGVDKGGVWRFLDAIPEGKYVPDDAPQLVLIPGRKKEKIARLDNGAPIPDPDAVFLIIHGPNGEDGTMQGLLRIMELPFVGPDVLGSAVSMDKAVAKQLLAAAGLNVANGFVVGAHEADDLDFNSAIVNAGFPLFIKPANMGSSVGVHKVKNEIEFKAAVKDAFLYDSKIIIEEMIVGREVECAVIGNEKPGVSMAGEVVVVSDEEYSFDAKYTSATAAKIIIPAKINAHDMENLRQTAIKAYQALNCEVLSRVDMFLTKDGKVYVNEINTLPGFTSISMYPKLWEDAGLSYTDLITELIELSIERYERRQGLKMEWRD